MSDAINAWPYRTASDGLGVAELESGQNCQKKGEQKMIWQFLDSLLSHPKHYLVQVITLATSALPRALLQNLLKLSVVITPGIDLEKRKVTTKHVEQKIFFYSFLVSSFFSFAVVLLLAFLDGVLLGQEPRRIYFLMDRWHIFLYSFLAPLYISTCIVIIYLSLKSRKELKGAYLYELNSLKTYDLLRLPISLVFTFSISAFSILNYIAEVADSSPSGKIYWFLKRNVDNDIIFNNLGVYYILLNFMALSIIVFSTLCFFSNFFHVIIFTIDMRCKKERESLPKISKIKQFLHSFIKMSIWMKFLIIFLAVNVIVWQKLDYAHGYNIYAAMIALTIAGLFLVSFPRLFAESVWANLRQEELGSTFPIKVEDFRPDSAKVLARVADTLLFVLIVIVIWRMEGFWRYLVRDLLSL